MPDGYTYLQPPGLTVHVDERGWARVQWGDAAEGILLDPHVYQVWSAVNGSTPADAAPRAGASTYLTACIIALLQHAGLLTLSAAEEEPLALTDQPSLSAPRVPTTDATAHSSTSTPGERLDVAVIVVHQQDQADLGACLRSLREQKDGVMGEVRVLTSTPPTHQALNAAVIECSPDNLIAALGEELGRVRGDAVLLLDSRVVLARMAVAEMADVLARRADIAAVTPRIMWQAWPAVVVGLGDWRIAPEEVWLCPHTGHVDVGQFAHRWREVPGVPGQAALLRVAAVQRVGLPEGGETLDWLGAAWSLQVRRHGFRTLAALRALAYAPWPASRQVGGQAPDHDWPANGPHPLVMDGMPALTVDNVRAVYAHCSGVTPRRVRPRVALLAAGGPHTTAVAHALDATCEVYHVEPATDDEALLREQLGNAELIVASAEALSLFDFLRMWPGPIVLDAPPAEPGSPAASTLLRQVDGAVCVRWPAPARADNSHARQQPPDEGEAWVIAAGRAGARRGVMPLDEFCRQPVMAPGREFEVRLGPSAVQPPPPPPTPARALPAKAWQILRQRGAGATVREVGRYIRWKVEG